jgi:plasmid stability protein
MATNIYLKDIDKDLCKALKQKALDSGKTIQAVCVDILTKAVKKGAK